MSFRSPLALVLCLALGCSGAASVRSMRTRPLVAREVDRTSFADIRREYLVLAPDDPDRRIVQARLLAYLQEGTSTLIAAGDYETIVGRLAEMTGLLAPVDLAEGASLPSGLEPLARFVAEHGAPRGDEARVLAALLILSRIETTNAEHDGEYERAALWGHDARLGRPGEARSLFDRLEGGQSLLDVWEEHARLSPAPEVLDRVARLHIELRDRLSTSRTERGFEPPRSMADLEAMSYVSALLERAPLEVAAVYLRVGDLALARQLVGEMGDESGTEWRIRRILDDARRDDDEGAQALLQLAVGFGEVRPDVSIAVCRNGRRRFPTRADFPLCLARLSNDAPADAAAWYAEAVRLSPDDRPVYDEALGAVPDMLGQATASDTGIGAVRTLVADAEWILEERNRRWPAEPSELTLASVRLGLAEAEAGAGFVEEARDALESSLALDRSTTALEELAALELSTSHADRAAALFTEALDSLTDQSSAGRLTRGLILAQLADARRLSGDSEAALRTYRQAFDALEGLVGRGDVGAEGLSFVHARLGVLARRLGDRAGSDRSLRAAMLAAPDQPGAFAETLAALVVVEPDGALAAEAFHGARVGSALEPSWKVYFALWAQLSAERAGTEPDPEVIDVLREHAEREGWHARLAAFATGAATEDELLAAATTSGERCEARFYSGARHLAAGQRDLANASFRAAIETGMVRYWEYRMALELLALP